MISQNQSGREFLQNIDELHEIQIPRSTFYDAMHSKRRLELVQKVTSLNYNSLVQQLCNDKVDYLQEFNEISEYDVFSVDGHYIEHSSHTQCDPKGKLYAAGNLYAINMRNSLMQHFAYVTDGTSKSHEMPYKDKTTLYYSFLPYTKKTNS